MTPKLIAPCPPFPWVLLLTQSERSHLQVVRDAPSLESVLRAQDLQKLRLLGIGGPTDPVVDIIQRSDAARHVLVTLAEKAGLDCRAHLDCRDGGFEVVLDLHRSGGSHLKVVSS